MKILVVDDESAIREWIKFSIEKMKLPDVEAIYTAASSKEALAIYEQYRPEMIFVDMVLPNVHGLELIKQLRAYGDTVKVYIISSHAVFDYVRTGLLYGVTEYILKEELNYEKLQGIVRTALEQKNSLATTRPFFWTYNNTSFIETICMSKDIQIDSAFLETYQISLCDNNIFVLIANKSLLDALELLKIPPTLQFSNCVYLTMRADCHVLLANVDGINRAKGQEALTYLHNNMKALLNQSDIAFGLATGLADLVTVVQSTWRELQMYFYDKMVSSSSTSIVYSEEIFEAQRKIFNARQKTGTIAGYRHDIECLLIELCEKKPIPINDVKCGIAEMFETIVQNMDDLLEQESVLRLHNKIMEARDFESLRCLTYEICDQIDSVAKLDLVLSSTVRLAVGYIRANLLERISLEDVALYVEQSPDYLSRLMKKELGESFLSYLTKLKMEKAVELLQNTHMKVYEVAEKLGYSNVSYFSELFRKWVGVNPCKYKRYYT